MQSDSLCNGDAIGRSSMVGLHLKHIQDQTKMRHAVWEGSRSGGRGHHPPGRAHGTLAVAGVLLAVTCRDGGISRKAARLGDVRLVSESGG
jgi:hypothetical protein